MTSRNPINPPRESDLPCINFFEMADTVKDVQKRGASQFPAYKRELSVVIEAFQVGESEHAASSAVVDFMSEIKKSIYSSGVTLGLPGVEIVEKDAGRILRPPGLEKVAGLGISVGIRYIEDVSKLF
jgi:hypothetical protein